MTAAHPHTSGSHTPGSHTPVSHTPVRRPVISRPPISVAVLDLLARARTTLESACHTGDASERYRGAHLGALRAAAALIAARSAPTPRARPRSVWQVLPGVAPELGEWAAFFAACSAHRSAIDRGDVVGARESDDLLRQAEMFLEIVQDLLGVPLTVPLPQSITPVSRSRASGA